MSTASCVSRAQINNIRCQASSTAQVLPGPDLFRAESLCESARFCSGANAPAAIQFHVSLVRFLYVPRDPLGCSADDIL